MSERKRILLISYFFAPQNTIGAVRPTKLAKYLSRMGHDVTVICGPGLDGNEDPALKRDLEQLNNVHVVEEWNPIRQRRLHKQSAAAAAPAAAGSAAPKRTGLKHRMVDALYLYLNLWTDRSFQRRAMKKIRELHQTYDVVLSSYWPWSVHMLARKVKKTGLAKCWIADFRDDVTVPFRWLNPWMKRYLRMIERDADVCEGVSQGIMDKMGIGENCRILCNGFDADDCANVQEVSRDPSVLMLAYCGQLSLGRKDVGVRDVSAVMQALGELVEEGVIRREEISLTYAGNDGSIFRQQAAAGGLEDCVQDLGRIKREEAIRLQMKADAILVATWNVTGITGLLSGKLFEALMMNKPVLCSVRGDLPNSAMGEVVRDTAAGYCYEEASGEDLSGMKEYLRRMIGLWREGRALGESIDRERLAFYSYEAIAGRLNGWMDEFLK